MTNKFFEVTYGSRLYGTNTPESDTDMKVVYVPELSDMLLGRKPAIFKDRFDVSGNRLGVNDTMPANGVETEFFPVQTFVRDFVNGQTYALEMAYAYLSHGEPKMGFGYNMEKPVYDFVKELVDNFANAEVYSMVGFAMKQTFDYVRRGERLNAAKEMLEAVDRLKKRVPVPPNLSGDPRAEARLDTMLDGLPLLDHLAKELNLETEVLVNGKKPQNSLKLNGRNYMETTTLEHLYNQLEKVVKQFGDRSNAAAETDVDYKSLSHAVRVYQQAIELLDHGTMTFPRPNAAYLLSVKQGKEDLETVKTLLRQLDDEVQAKVLSSTMQKKTPELQQAAEEWLLKQLKSLYELNED